MTEKTKGPAEDLLRQIKYAEQRILSAYHVSPTGSLDRDDAATDYQRLVKRLKNEHGWLYLGNGEVRGSGKWSRCECSDCK